MNIKLLLLAGLCILVSNINSSQSFAAQSTYNKEIAQTVAECEAKFRAVCNKENFFVDSMADHELKKAYYLKLYNNFRVWLEQSKIILHTLQPDEVQQNVSDFTQTCQEYYTKLSEFLSWAEGKTPPGGFSMAKPDAYFKKELQSD